MSHGTGYTQIRRGPMAGDQFTQIHNGVFRDARLSATAIAVFGYISTHQQGWETSAEQIARQIKPGIVAVKKALRELVERHYLVRGQDRRANGTHGQSWLFLTDLPAQLAALGVTDDAAVAAQVRAALDDWLTQHPRSEPAYRIDTAVDVGETAGQNRRTADRSPVKPPAVRRPPKNTNGLEHQAPQEHHSSALALTDSSSKQASTAYTNISLDDLGVDELLEWVEDHPKIGGYETCEQQAALAMLDRGEPPLKVVHTLARQRREGYALARR